MKGSGRKIRLDWVMCSGRSGGFVERRSERVLCNMSPNYACPCLNVQLRALRPPPSSSSPPLSHENYQPLYVGQDGIFIVHTSLLYFYILFIFSFRFTHN